MELKRPRQMGTTSRVGDCLQHEAALNVQARIDAEARRRRQRERAQFLRFLMRGLLVVVFVGGGSWAWQKGWFDKYLGEDEREFEPVGDEAAADVSSSEDRNASASVGVGTESEGAVDALRAAEAKFAGATLGYWKNAAVEDRPVKGRPPLVFTGLVPDGKGGRMLFELTRVWGKPLTARRLAEGGGAQILSKAAFEKLVGAMPIWSCARGGPTSVPTRRSGRPIRFRGGGRPSIRRATNTGPSSTFCLT